MRRFARFAIIVALVVLSISLFRSYRVRAVAEEAARFAPAAVKPVLVPAGTTIPAVIWNGVAESDEAGDRITAVVSPALVVNGKFMIPSGALLKGELKRISVSNGTARVRISFGALVIAGRNMTIQAQRLDADVPVQSDFHILGSALSTLLGGSIGAAAAGGVRGQGHCRPRGN